MINVDLDSDIARVSDNDNHDFNASFGCSLCRFDLTVVPFYGCSFILQFAHLIVFHVSSLKRPTQVAISQIE